MVLGANIGTTITGALASIKGSKNAKRVAFIHTLYNLIGTIIILPLISPISKLLGAVETRFLSPETKMMTIALVHMLFNTTMCIFFWIITPVCKLAKLLLKISKLMMNYRSLR